MRVLAGAPEELRPLLDRAYRARDGVRVAMRTGPTLRFGAPIRVAAKWAAVARVLADPSAGGATELDVRAAGASRRDLRRRARPGGGDPGRHRSGARHGPGRRDRRDGGPAASGRNRHVFSRGRAASTLSRGLQPSSTRVGKLPTTR